MHTTIEEMREVLEFVQHAAQRFAKDKSLATIGTTAPGSLLAIRWGLTDKAMRVVRLDKEFEVLTVADCIKEDPEAGPEFHGEIGKKEGARR